VARCARFAGRQHIVPPAHRNRPFLDLATHGLHVDVHEPYLFGPFLTAGKSSPGPCGSGLTTRPHTEMGPLSDAQGVDSSSVFRLPSDFRLPAGIGARRVVGYVRLDVRVVHRA
jgi:hypothetical protein